MGRSPIRRRRCCAASRPTLAATSSRLARRCTRWPPADARSAATAVTPFVRRSRPAHRSPCLTRIRVSIAGWLRSSRQRWRPRASVGINARLRFAARSRRRRAGRWPPCGSPRLPRRHLSWRASGRCSGATLRGRPHWRSARSRSSRSNRSSPAERTMSTSAWQSPTRSITEFGTIEALAVRPLSASSRYGAPGVDAVAAGRALDAELVVDGAIQRSGDRLRVSVHLIRVADGVAIWSDRFETRWTDVFAVQDSIAEQVTRALAVTLSGEDRRRVQRRRPASVEAYEAYLKGRYFWNMRTGEGLTRALGYFQEALELDPGYAQAHAGLADTYAVLGSTAIAALPPRDAGPKAIAAAARALELDPSLAEAHVSFAFAIYSYEWDWARGEEHFRRAIALDADYATAHYWYCAVPRSTGPARGGRRRSAARRRSRAVVAGRHLRRGADTLLRASFRSGSRIRATHPRSRSRLSPRPAVAGIESAWLRAVTQRRSSPTNGCARAAPENSLYGGWLAHVYGRAGRTAQARAILSRLSNRPNARQLGAANIAIGYIGIGDHGTALSWLETAYAEHSQALTYLKVDPVYDPLRADRRFVDLLQRVGLNR